MTEVWHVGFKRGEKEYVIELDVVALEINEPYSRETAVRHAITQFSLVGHELTAAEVVYYEQEYV